MDYNTKKKDRMSIAVSRPKRHIVSLKVSSGSSRPTITVSSIQTSAEMPSQIVAGVRIDNFKATSGTTLLTA
jgi:hypothetical protein